MKDKNVSRDDSHHSLLFLISNTFMEWKVPFIYALKSLLIYFVMISFLSLTSNPDFRLEIDLKLLADKMY